MKDKGTSPEKDLEKHREGVCTEESFCQQFDIWGCKTKRLLPQLEISKFRGSHRKVTNPRRWGVGELQRSQKVIEVTWGSVLKAEEFGSYCWQKAAEDVFNELQAYSCVTEFSLVSFEFTYLIWKQKICVLNEIVEGIIKLKMQFPS